MLLQRDDPYAKARSMTRRCLGKWELGRGFCMAGTAYAKCLLWEERSQRPGGRGNVMGREAGAADRDWPVLGKPHEKSPL